MGAAQAAALAGAVAHGAQGVDDAGMVQADAVTARTDAPVRLQLNPRGPRPNALWPERDVASVGIARALALDGDAEGFGRFVGFVGLVRVCMVLFAEEFKLAERPQARDPAQFFRRPSAPELAAISRR